MPSSSKLGPATAQVVDTILGSNRHPEQGSPSRRNCDRHQFGILIAFAGIRTLLRGVCLRPAPYPFALFPDVHGQGFSVETDARFPERTDRRGILDLPNAHGEKRIAGCPRVFSRS